MMANRRIQRQRRALSPRDIVMPTKRLLIAAWTGLNSSDERISDAAESVFSYMLSRLRSTTIIVPEELAEQVDLLLGRSK